MIWPNLDGDESRDSRSRTTSARYINRASRQGGSKIKQFTTSTNRNHDHAMGTELPFHNACLSFSPQSRPVTHERYYSPTWAALLDHSRFRLRFQVSWCRTYQWKHERDSSASIHGRVRAAPQPGLRTGVSARDRQVYEPVRAPVQAVIKGSGTQGSNLPASSVPSPLTSDHPCWWPTRTIMDSSTQLFLQSQLPWPLQNVAPDASQFQSLRHLGLSVKPLPFIAYARHSERRQIRRVACR